MGSGFNALPAAEKRVFIRNCLTFRVSWKVG